MLLKKHFIARLIMLNSPDPQTKEDLKQKMESVSEQIDMEQMIFLFTIKHNGI